MSIVVSAVNRKALFKVLLCATIDSSPSTFFIERRM
jgi:hypothetical protein